jgi:hypothetical protein
LSSPSGPERQALEVALHVPDARRLAAAGGTSDVAGLGPIGRLYFGVAFCQHLLPSPADVGLARAFAAQRGWAFSLLLPYVTDRFLPAIDSLLDALRPGDEAIVEDWGVLRRARGRGLVLVLGRGLNRMMRDPRVPDVGPEHLRGDRLPDSWRSTSGASSAFARVIAALGVSRLETDWPLQGLEPLPPAAPRTALHLPFGMIATGRLCLMSALGKPPSVRFTAPLACDAPCRDYTVTLRAPWSRREAASDLPRDPVPDGSFLPLSSLLNRRRNTLPEAELDAAPRFLLKGNTHFYALPADSQAAALRWATLSAPVDRVVHAPQLPM